jgi:hypothetical protein
VEPPSVRRLSLYKEYYIEHINPLLLYIAVSACATVYGLLYWMAIENLGKVKFKYALTFILSMFLTPFGAWVVSLVLKARQLGKELKQLDKSAA